MLTYDKLIEELVRLRAESESFQWQIGLLFLDSLGAEGDSFGGRSFVQICNDAGLDSPNCYVWRKVARVLGPWYEVHKAVKPPFLHCRLAVKRAALSLRDCPDDPLDDDESQHRNRAEWIMGQWLATGKKTYTGFAEWVESLLLANESDSDPLTAKRRAAVKQAQRLSKAADQLIELAQFDRRYVPRELVETLFGKFKKVVAIRRGLFNTLRSKRAADSNRRPELLGDAAAPAVATIEITAAE